MLVLIFLTAAACAFVQTTTGFGYGILFMSICPYYMPINIGSVLNLSTSVLGNLANSLRRFKKINWKQVLIPAVFAAVSTYVSVELTKGVSTEAFRKVLGILLFLLAIWFAFFSKKIKIKSTPLNGAIAGLVSGVGTGLFSVGGPPVVLYYFSALPDKEEYMATIQMYFFFNSMQTMIIKLATGVFPAFSPSWFLVGIAGLSLGLVLGNICYSKLNGELLKKCIYGFMAFSGLLIFFGK